tara:strand:- start:6446 stop:7045 length:600 start_codon:yes stop_codon:yes gene_type:complete
MEFKIFSNNYYVNFKRIFDIFFSISVLIILLPILFFLFIIHIILEKGNFIFWSKRVGINNHIFFMPKLRTMKTSTPDVATHLLGNDNNYITNIGKILRKTSLDEIPQLYSVLKGDMSIVGPRPALHNQYDLIQLRTESGVHKLKPGITGLAQVSGRDLLSIPEKVEYDKMYLIKKNFLLDIKIICITVFKLFKSKDILH